MLTTHYSFWVGYSLLFGLLLLPFWNLLITIAQESVAKEFTASVTGIVQTSGLIGSALGPIIAGGLISILGINQALIYSITIPTFVYGILALAILKTCAERTPSVRDSASC